MRVFGIAGYSGSGKTTLIEQLIPRFVMEGFRVSVIKHAHHGFDVDQPGKDSHRHREAGAFEVLVTSPNRWVLMHELRGRPEPTLEEQLKRFSACDLVLIEGFKKQDFPKLEVHRQATGKPLLYPTDQRVVAVATDEPLNTALPQFQLDDYDAICGFIMNYTGLDRRRACRVETRRERNEDRIMVKILYFARLREAFGTSAEEVTGVSGIRDVASLVEWLRLRGSPWAEELAPGRAVRVAVNQQMAGLDTAVGDGDEVAFFPPVTGG